MTQAEHLEAAAIGQDRPVPTHKRMQATQLGHTLRAGAQRQVIGVAQDDLGATLLEFVRRDRLDRGLRAHWHKDRRGHMPMGGPQQPGTGRRVGILG